jgi:hypothetical protein
MPLLDVTDVLYDPDFCESMVVFRRPVTIGNNGRETISTYQILPKPTGVIVPSFQEQISNQTERLPDMSYTPRAIRVYSTFILQGIVPGFLGDVILYQGDNFVVNKIISFTHWGEGFIAAECKAIDSFDMPPSYS